MKFNFDHIDKNSIKHFLICFGLSALFGRTGAGAAVGSGLYKEYTDLTEAWYHHWCWWDVTFDILGAILGLVLNTMFQILIFKAVIY